MRVLFAGGGTAGHINPALAIANDVQEKEPDSRFLFVGTQRGMEHDLVPRAGYPIEFIDVQGFDRSLSLRNAQAVLKAWKAIHHSTRIIKEFCPDIVVGTGGYVSGPVLFAAAKRGIPTLIHEQNVFPGMTSKLLSGRVDTVCISFEESRVRFPKAKHIVHTGNPIRPEVLSASREQAREALGITRPIFIAASGGSLGAEQFNKAVVGLIGKYRSNPDCALLLGTGERGYQKVLQLCAKQGIDLQQLPQVFVVPYIHNMADVMAAADLFIARAGAITLSELGVMGKPAILVPSPNVTDNHQEYNARALEKAGAAVVIIDAELTGKTLTDAVTRLLANPSKRARMEQASRAMGVMDGTQRIYKEMRRLIEK